MVWRAPLLMVTPTDVRAAAWRTVARRVAVADACVGGLLVGRLHCAMVNRTLVLARSPALDVDPDRALCTFAVGLCTAALTTGLVAWWALSVQPDRPVAPLRMLGRAVAAAAANYGAWVSLITLLLVPFGDPIDAPFVRPLAGHLPLLEGLGRQLSIGWLMALCITVPLGLAFGLAHVGALQAVRRATSVRSLQPLAHARLFGAAWMLLASGLAASVDGSAYVGEPRAWWSVPATAGLALIAIADLTTFASTEWRARRLLAQALAGTSSVLRVASGEQVTAGDVIPLAPLGPRPVQLISAESAPHFRVAGDAPIVALIPRSLAPPHRPTEAS